MRSARVAYCALHSLPEFRSKPMADDGSKRADTWPLPRFRFSVDFGDGMKVRFEEVPALDAETQRMANVNHQPGFQGRRKRPGD
jgi:hypothetical protein